MASYANIRKSLLQELDDIREEMHRYYKMHINATSEYLSQLHKREIELLESINSQSTCEECDNSCPHFYCYK